jgi:hypothetical protein
VTIVIGIAILILSVSQMGWRDEDCTVRGIEKLSLCAIILPVKKKGRNTALNTVFSLLSTSPIVSNCIRFSNK